MLINSLVGWLCSGTLGLVLFQIVMKIRYAFWLLTYENKIIFLLLTLYLIEPLTLSANLACSLCPEVVKVGFMRLKDQSPPPPHTHTHTHTHMHTHTHAHTHTCTHTHAHAHTHMHAHTHTHTHTHRGTQHTLLSVVLTAWGDELWWSNLCFVSVSFTQRYLWGETSWVREPVSEPCCCCC